MKKAEPPPPDCAHTPSQKVRQAPDRSGAFLCTPTPYHHFNRRFESGGVTSGTWRSQISA